MQRFCLSTNGVWSLRKILRGNPLFQIKRFLTSKSLRYRILHCWLLQVSWVITQEPRHRVAVLERSGLGVSMNVCEAIKLQSVS